MNDAWANSTDTTPVTAADGRETTTDGRADREPYADRNDTAPRERESRRSRSRSPIRNGADHRGRDDSNNPGTNLHISGLNSRVTDRHLEDAFGKYGKVEKAQVVYDPHTRDSRCFAFVMMSNLEEAEAAIAGLNGHVLEGSALRVDKARRGRARTPTPGRFYGKKGYERDYYERPYFPRDYDRYDGYYERRFDRDRDYDRYRFDEDRYSGDRERYSSRSRWDEREDYYRERDYRSRDDYGDRYYSRGRYDSRR